MGILDKFLGRTKHGVNLSESKDMIVSVDSIRHIVLLGNTKNGDEAKWWDEVGLVAAFANYNPELEHALSLLGRKNYKESRGCVVGKKHPDLIGEVASFLKENFPNDSHVFQFGAVGSTDKDLCEVIFAVAFATPANTKPYVAMVNLPRKIMPSDH